MGNFFGPSLTTNFRLIDPRRIAVARSRFHRQVIPDLELANSLFVSSGKWPARGFILLRRSDYNQLNTYGTSFVLQIDSLNPQLPPVTFTDLAIVQARCVSRGLSSDANAIYLVEITDRRGLLWNRWFQFPTTSAYNVRAPAYPQGFYLPSINGQALWTWDTMVGNLWNQMAQLGPYPHLPFTPDATPENWWFPGESVWEALSSILDLLGCAVSVDLTATNPYGIVKVGNADTVFSTLQTKSLPFLQDDYEWIDTGSGRVPKQVTVYFHRRNDQYGTEETIRQDSFQWAMTPIYSVTVQGPAQFSTAVGTHLIWSDFTVRYDVDGNPFAADTATAAIVAADEASQYYNRITRGTQGFMTQVYGGAIPFATGSLVDGVRWFETEKDGRLGWQTMIVRGLYPAFTEVTFEPR